MDVTPYNAYDNANAEEHDDDPGTDLATPFAIGHDFVGEWLLKLGENN